MHLIAPSTKPIISVENVTGFDIAFVADPFRIAVRGAIFVFAEAWNRSTQRGQIALFQLNERCQVVDSGIVLVEPFHLSYPCVFKYDGDYYMLPEAWESGQLILYRARRFPWVWERRRVLLELDYADPQIFFHENAWYMFLNTDPLTNASASVFWAESPLGKWHPHPQNPICSGDPLRARSAGPLIRYNGRTFRFTQDCRQRYGQSLYASEIVELSPSRICTVAVGQVELDRPEWARSAFHHIDVFTDNGVLRALIDGYSGALDPQP
jgi:hypothetical protein